MIEEAQLDAAARAMGAAAVHSLLDEWRGVVWIKPSIVDCLAWTKATWARCRSGETHAALILLPARTDTEYCQFMMRRADAGCFLRGRVRFTGKPGGAPFPSAVFYLGTELEQFLTEFEPFVNGWNIPQRHHQRAREYYLALSVT